MMNALPIYYEAKLVANVSFDSHGFPDFFSFKPADIIRELGLKSPVFSASTNYSHFGKADLPWEKQDSKKLDKLKS